MSKTTSPFIIAKKHQAVQQLKVSALSSMMLLAASGAMAAEAPKKDDKKDEPTSKLSTVKVNADAIDSSEIKIDKVSSPKFTQPLIDTPQTIQVISNVVFTQQGATTLTEALRNSAAVGTFYAGENGSTSTGDAIYMRGFDTSSSIFVDGIRDLGTISRDLFNIDQVEVQKGPAGTDNGRSAPTGAINLTSKQASLESAASSNISVGADGQRRATIDLNQTLTNLPGSALRLNVLWQDSDVPGRDHINNKRVGIAPSLGFGLDGDTRAYVNLLYVKQDNVPDGFVPTVGLPHWQPQAGLQNLVGHPVDSENFYGSRDDHDDVTAKMATVKIEHDFSSDVKLTNSLRWGQTDQDDLLTSYTATGAVTNGLPTGNIKWTNATDLSTYTLARGNTNLKNVENGILTDQLNLRVDFETGSVKHNLSTGLEITHEEQTNYGLAGTGTRPAANLYNPDWNTPTSTYAVAHTGANNEGQTNTGSLYAFDTLKFGAREKFLVTGGVRIDDYKTVYEGHAVCNNGTVPCAGAAVGSPVKNVYLEAEDTLVNWKLGAVYKPTGNSSIYANYAISQQPPGGANFTLSSALNNAANPNMDPQKAKTSEIGAKWDTLGEKLLLNLAFFRTNVSNEINSQILDESGNPTQTGEKRVEGVELSAIGNLTENWSITAGYTDMKTKVEVGPFTAADGTPNLTYTPDQAFTSWTSYRFPFGLTIGGGASYTAGLHRGTDGAVGTPAFTDSYVVYNAVVSYDINAYTSLRLNAYNLTDKEYVASINKSGYRYTPGTPRTFLLSADFRF